MGTFDGITSVFDRDGIYDVVCRFHQGVYSKILEKLDRIHFIGNGHCHLSSVEMLFEDFRNCNVDGFWIGWLNCYGISHENPEMCFQDDDGTQFG